MIILSSIQANFWITAIAATTLIMAAAYTLYMYKRVFFGPITQPHVEHLTDVKGMEKMVFVLLGVAVLFIGIYPEPLLNVLHTSIANLLQISLQSKL